MNFKNIDLKIKYTTYDDNVISDFYNPVLKNSIRYDRAVGYFSSAALLAYIKGLKKFIKNNGKIRLIISPVLNQNDIEAIVKSREDTVRKTIDLFNMFLEDEESKVSSQILFYLLKKNILDIKIAEQANDKGIFHDKIGVFEDGNGNKIAMNGSNNETFAALMNNTESFNIYKGWIDGLDEYVISHEIDFERYWTNQVSGINFIDIKEILPSEIIEKFESNDSIDILFDKLNNQESKSRLLFKPYDYQIEASTNWFLNKKGILKMATGTGKTKTAIYINERLREISEKLFTLIIVPDITLINQWEQELSKYYDQIIKCYSGDKWFINLKDEIDIFKFEENRQTLVMSTIQTFYTDRFRDQLSKLNNQYFMIADEMHRFGTINKMKALTQPKMILGLSATPEIHGNEILTKQLFKYFGGIVFEYNLEEAIKNNRLVPYYYYPYIVDLNENEKLAYSDITKKIVRLMGTDEESDYSSDPILQSYLFKRARIIYGANNKLIQLEDIIENIEKKGNLVIYSGITSEKEIENINNYQDDIKRDEDRDPEVFLKQIDSVGNILKDKNIRFTKYTSNESEQDRKDAIKSFEDKTYSTLLAIRCLDEGVDIPSIERAVILASSTNPREFVQRRGRILRKKPGKTHSEIFDFLVLQPNDESSNYSTLNKKELARYYEFSRLAINKNELLNNYEKYKFEYIKE